MKNLSKTILAFLACGLLSCSFFCQQAQAVVIGAIEFQGMVTLSSGPNMTSILMFNSVTTTTRGTGIYDSIQAGTAADFHALTIDNTTHRIIWEVPPLTEFISVDTPEDFHFIEPGGQGSVRLGPPTWSFQIFGGTRAEGDSIPINTFGFFNFSGSGTANPIRFTGRVVVAPDGGSAVALLGIALLGLEGLRRKLRAS
jgi:hypothetical protein